MKNRLSLLAILSLFVAVGVAHATGVFWSRPSTITPSSLAVFSSGTYSNAPDDTQGDGGTIAGAGVSGLVLSGLKGFSVTVTSAQAMTAGGILRAYLYNPIAAGWERAVDLDLTVTASTAQTFAGFRVTSDVGRVAFVPYGVGVACSIYLVGN